MPWDTSAFTDPYNLPYLLTLGAYVIHEMLGLRSVLAAAHLGYLVLAITGGHQAGVFWNVLFLSINLWHVGRILWARRKITFEAEVEALYQQTFSLLTRLEFRQFWNLGKEAQQQGVWLDEGQLPDCLSLVVEGQVLVTKGEGELNRLSPGRFFAEMGYLTRRGASATIQSTQVVRCRQWAYSVLEGIERDHTELWAKLQAILGREMAQKIAEQNPPSAISR